MSLFGRLDAMPLEDIIQILSMAKRTGRLALTRGQEKGAIAFRNGEIIYASCDGQRESLGQMLRRLDIVTEDQLSWALGVQEQLSPRVLLGTVLVDMGAVSPDALKSVLVEKVEKVLCELLTWKSGAFRFEPIADRDRLQSESDDRDLVLAAGASPEHLVLEAYRRLDERIRDGEDPATATQLIHFPTLAERTVPRAPARREAEASPDDALARGRALAALKEFLQLDDEDLPDLDTGEEAGEAVAADVNDLALLRAIMDEIRSPTFTGEVSLMILRFAAELLDRGALFAVRPGGFGIIGEFGLKLSDAAAEAALRRTVLPADRGSILLQVVESGRSFKGRIPDSAANRHLLAVLGNARPTESIAVPLAVRGAVMAVLYGDTGDRNAPISSIDCFELLMIHASLGIEKTMLEKKMKPQPWLRKE